MYLSIVWPLIGLYDTDGDIHISTQDSSIYWNHAYFMYMNYINMKFVYFKQI
jgi:hypothetical protein